MRPNNIHNLLILSNKFQFIFGTKRLTIVHGSIVKTSKNYNVYSIIVGILISVAMCFCVKQSIQNISTILPPPLLFTVIISFCMLTLAYFIIMFYDTASKSIYYLRIYTTLIDINNIFNIIPNSVLRKYFNLYHAIYLIWKIFCITCEIIDEYNSSIILKIIHITIELEILNYVLKVNEVARNFEKLNYCLMRLQANNKMDLNIQDGIMMNLWKSKTLVINDSISLAQLMIVFNKLVKVVDDICSFYGSQVNFFSVVII